MSIAEIDDFIDRVAEELESHQVCMVKSIWAELKSIPDIELPAIMIGEGEDTIDADKLSFSWSKNHRYMEIAVHDGGMIEWFIGVTLDNGKSFADGTNDPEKTIDRGLVFGYLKQYFPRPK